MVELDLVILKLFLAVLASIVVTPNDSHHCREAQVPTANSPFLLSFSHRFGGKEDRADMAEDGACGFAENFWNALRVSRQV